MFEEIIKYEHINYESTIAVWASTIIWTCFYNFVRYLLPDIPFTHPEWKTNYTQSFLMVFSLGYFIYDLIWMYLFELQQEKLMITHHIYCIVALFKMLFKGTSGAQATCALGSMEITNPFLQYRWFIRSEGMYPSALHSAMETTFYIIFFLVRIVLGSYYMVVILRQEHNDVDFIFLALAIYVISWMFQINIIKCILVKYGFVEKIKYN
ncbi:unnamed protein product [Psylliodes chrysocephalus]|uniref:TLC domain-containing protein n=1 Tax=Psylliodes chrysocephalus TaxID=3402493 RepID=A0A9P0G4T2_9CUCU|nr:unnamed protein product [Psylliodes chrysocephala]